MISAAGRKLNAVIMAKICNDTEYSCEPSLLVITFTADITELSAHATEVKKSSTSDSNTVNLFFIMLFHHLG